MFLTTSLRFVYPSSFISASIFAVSSSEQVKDNCARDNRLRDWF